MAIIVVICTVLSYAVLVAQCQVYVIEDKHEQRISVLESSISNATTCCSTLEKEMGRWKTRTNNFWPWCRICLYRYCLFSRRWTLWQLFLAQPWRQQCRPNLWLRSLTNRPPPPSATTPAIFHNRIFLVLQYINQFFHLYINLVLLYSGHQPTSYNREYVI